MVKQNDNKTENPPRDVPRGYDVDPQNSAKEEFPLREFFSVLHRRRRSVILVWLAVALLGVVLVLTRRPKYEATALLVVAVQNPSANASSDSLLSPLQALTQSRNTATQVEVLQSAELVRQAYLPLGAKTIDEAFSPNPEDAALQLPPKWSFKVENKEDTDAVVIIVDSYDPKVSAAFANAVAKTYLNRDLEQNNHSTREARTFVGAELARAKKQYIDASKKLERLKMETGLVSADTQVAAEATRLYALKGAVDAAQALVAASDNRMAQLQQMMKGANESLPPDVSTISIQAQKTIQENPNFITELGRLNDLIAARSQLATAFRDGSLEIRQADKRISDQRKIMARTAQDLLGASTTEANPVRQTLLAQYATEIANNFAAKAQLESAKASVGQSQGVMNTFPKLQREFAATTLDVSVLSTGYQNLFTQYDSLLVAEHSNLPNGLVASKATPPPYPYFPSALTYAMVVIGSMLCAVFVAIGAERLDIRLHDPSTVEATIGSTMLALVPTQASQIQPGKWPLLEENASTTMHGLLEAYRTLRNNLYFSAPGQPARILAVTSPGPSEGKTTTTVNTAIALGMDGKRVLIIDADLRRPAVAKALGLERDKGLTTVVAGLTTAEEAIVPTRFRNVFALTSGPLPPNPTEFLNSPRCGDVIQNLGQQFDYVLVDSPPTAGISDVQVISRVVDGVVLVVALDRSTKPALEITARTFEQAGARLLGFVLNFVERDRPGYYGYYAYYNYYYESYYSEGQEKGTGGKRKRRTKASK